ncbi:MAG: hypothetical protein DRO93_11075 [Candidatus Thorarchaeota archaeon]|nr:MAG: hypothetical protein DRO93_11075 [Candidatus Thorarchaeota archaeon]
MESCRGVSHGVLSTENILDILGFFVRESGWKHASWRVEYGGAFADAHTFARVGGQSKRVSGEQMTDKFYTMDRQGFQTAAAQYTNGH